MSLPSSVGIKVITIIATEAANLMFARIRDSASMDVSRLLHRAWYAGEGTAVRMKNTLKGPPPRAGRDRNKRLRHDQGAVWEIH